ncbi:uncharacterized protein BJX67DRAFT_192811 [Aspergillus lucknowensis]|uniref:Uncharacterized protein n=1 Tax=Aspergillus lucknowensis TaxID=176173 RepID=A0ABR4LKN6_9EURO
MPRPSPPGATPEKNMSSRLLTMKFMQRAAASAAAKESSRPESSSNSQVSTPKKRRISASPDEGPSAARSSDLEAISAALAEEEGRRRDALSRQAAEAGETEWFIDFEGTDTVNQYSQQPVLAEYSLDADDDDNLYGGRQVYGNYKRKNKLKPTGNGEVAQDASTETDVQAMINQNKPKKVNLKDLTSISGAGGRPSPGGRPNPSAGKDKSQKKRKHK